MLDAYSPEDDLQKMIGLHTLFPGAERENIRPSVGASATYSLMRELLQSLPISGTFLERLLALEIRTSLPDNLLLLGDKLSMASGLEVRVPMLDPIYLKQVERLPGNWRRGGLLAQRGKLLHKQVCKSLLPEEIINRRKKGFQTPMEGWFKRELGDQIYDMVDDKQSFTRTFLKVQEAKNLLKFHQLGRYGNLERQLFAIWILEEWYRGFFVKGFAQN